VSFSLDVLMVHSSALAVATDGERLMCSGFSLGDTVHFGSLEFIADCFGGLSLSPKGSDLGAIFVGTTHSGSLSLRAMTEDSINKLYKASSREGSSGLPISGRHNTGALPAPITTTPWPEDIPATQTMTTVPPRMLTSWLDTGLPLE
jgi:hypothetical protein